MHIISGGNMLIIKHSIETKASPEAIWNIWKDVENWKTWDHGIEYSTIDGPFVAGTTGTLKPKGGPLVKTMLTEVEPLKRFVDESQLCFAKIIVSHELEQVGGKTLVTTQIEMNGPLAFIFAFLIGRQMKKNLPQEMAAMVKIAEEMSF
jgi:hypothetical protein